MNSKKQHWDTVFAQKTPEQVSWHQPVPEISLRLINDCAQSLTKAGFGTQFSILDVGSGDSLLPDHLIQNPIFEYCISLLDISENALQRARQRLGENPRVQYLPSDILSIELETPIHIWHDRAVFHFLTTPEEQHRYAETAAATVIQNGFMVLGTFSETGPEKCSGLTVCRHTPESLQAIFGDTFWRLHCIEETHTTPFGTTEDFLFCVFQRLGDAQS
jgi:SAM-dependent methyltransferase